MKSLRLISLAATAAGFVLLPVNFALGASLLFATGFAAIIVTDYTRAHRRLRLPATVALGARLEKFGLAA
jgi:hypothetical protein